MYRTIGSSLNIKSFDLAPEIEIPDDDEEEEDAADKTSTSSTTDSASSDDIGSDEL